MNYCEEEIIEVQIGDVVEFRIGETNFEGVILNLFVKAKKAQIKYQTGAYTKSGKIIFSAGRLPVRDLEFARREF